MINPTEILRKSRSWLDFKDFLGDLTKKGKGDCFELLTKYFLQLHPTYVTQLKHVWLLREVPPTVRKKLHLPDPDEGIDLIAETTDSTHWAIQCKYKEDETKSLTRRELSTFTDLAFTICKGIELGLVCTSADRFSHKLKKYGERLSFCAGDMWRSLDGEFFKRLHRHLDGKAAPLRACKPLPHQRRAINNAEKHFLEDRNSRGKLIMPCGTGKSLTGYWIAEKLGAKRILVAVPSLALIRQTLEVWAKESVAKGHNVSWIAVCSDESVGRIERDDFAVLTQDLGVRVHTDPKEISEWLKAHKHGTNVVFTTYQSGKAIADAAKRARITFDLGIMDEAHKTVGKRDALFSYLLYDKNIAIKKRIFMTATERRYLGSSDQIASMDDPDLYGDTVEFLSFKSALVSKPPILSDYRIITIMVSKAEIASLIEKNLLVRPDKGSWSKDVEAEMLAGVIALRKAMQRYPIRHAVSFHSSIARARAFRATQDTFSSAFPKYGQLETFHVSGKTPTAIRSREMNEFASSGRSLVTNARCLTEGVDVPDIDCVMFADPKRSAVDIVQAVGRALRTAKGKNYGYVVVPVLLEEEAISYSNSRSSAYDSILAVLRALAANDERIVEYFRGISQGKQWRGESIPVEIDVPTGLGIDADEFVYSIELRLWDRLAKLSWRPFEKARSFAHSLNLRGYIEWTQYCKGEFPEKPKKPSDIPTSPHTAYKNEGWTSWVDWVGTSFYEFEKARTFVRKLELKNQAEWFKYCKGELPSKGARARGIPSNPHLAYKGVGWSGYGDWIGTGRRRENWRPFIEAREFARNLGLKSANEWRKYCRGELEKGAEKPDDIPTKPYDSYKEEGWLNWGDWLGTGSVAPADKKFRPFKEAREFTHRLNLKSQSEWYRYLKGEMAGKKSKPDDITNSPYHIYKDKGWVSWPDWLGTSKKKRGNS